MASERGLVSAYRHVDVRDPSDPQLPPMAPPRPFEDISAFWTDGHRGRKPAPRVVPLLVRTSFLDHFWIISGPMDIVDVCRHHGSWASWTCDGTTGRTSSGSYLFSGSFLDHFWTDGHRGRVPAPRVVPLLRRVQQAAGARQRGAPTANGGALQPGGVHGLPHAHLRPARWARQLAPPVAPSLSPTF
eukprot:8218530-Pyramimonas_sp.AAC.2